MSTRTRLSSAAAILACAVPAWAAAPSPIQLKFEGLTVDVGGTRADVRVDNFYDGGTSKTFDPPPNDAAAGVKLGVTTRGDLATASETAAQANPAGGTGINLVVPYLRNLTFSGGAKESASTELGLGFMYVQGDASGNAAASFDVAGGFDTGVSFFYSTSLSQDLSVAILDGFNPDGSEDAVATLTLSATPACAGDFTRCEWAEAFVPYDGTATGVRFSGSSASFFVDNLTFGSRSARTLPDGPQPAPEPSTYALMALGLGGIAFAARRRQHRS
jgi:hypothetical protein